ncbi:sensor domain-containing protein [Natronospira bacteriovora]|uniref:EAL domain-containing protein n=1 Tax=Natronospira bacteriovora TaxID=3069753 RepID=A0ABU0W3X6_9GAMM|nr:EAL domain-containing protein [Natronospira sp. AB-CW4]MDQ2068724.1 EAL domain-containing protein [Natronospira sp. AB-CW4]
MPSDEKLYRALFEASSYAVLVLASNQVVASTPAAARLFGYHDREELIGLHPSELSPPKQPGGQSSRDVASRHIRQALNEGYIRFEWTHCRADGTPFPCEVIITRLDFSDGPLLRATVRDISHEKATQDSLQKKASSLEERLVQQNEKLAHANDELARDLAALRRTEKALEDQRSFFKQLFDASPEGIVLLDRKDRILRANRAWLELFGYQAKEVLGHEINELIVPASAGEEGRHLSERVLSSESIQSDSVRRRKDGSLVEVSILGAPIHIDEDQIGVYGIYRDVTDQRRAENQYRLAAAALENTAEGVMILDQDRKVVSVNKAFTRITGYSRQEVLGRPMPLRSVESNGEPLGDAVWNALKADGHWQGEVWNRRKCGEAYPELLSLSTVKDAEGELTHYVCIFNDITQNKEYEKRLEYLAHHDALTGLPNRARFEEECQHAIARASRRGDFAGILFLDLDQFKMVNDSLGHPVGDRLIVAVAERLAHLLRSSDIVARFGGDEFAVLVEDIEGPDDLAGIAGKILASLAEPIEVSGHELITSCSIGVSCYPQDGDSPATLLRNADTAMYRAKEKGRNSYQFFAADMNARAYEELLMSKALRDALNERQFVLHYQPSVSLQDYRITGVEALVRWVHPEQGLIPPSAFVPLAERNGLIGELGQWVFSEACRQAAEWRSMGLPPLRVAVNVSARQFNRRRLVAELSEVIAKSGMVAADLHLEITESMMMENPKRALTTLREVAEMGIDIAVDDFGTGHSSLSYLKDFPIHFLKIDRSFVMGLPEDEDALAIVRAIVAMAHNLNLKVIAEGVETAAQRDLLAAIGCDEAQGYFFSRPRRADDVIKLLRNGKPLP